MSLGQVRRRSRRRTDLDLRRPVAQESLKSNPTSRHTVEPVVVLLNKPMSTRVLACPDTALHAA
jgi:hypothetical protein